VTEKTFNIFGRRVELHTDAWCWKHPVEIPKHFANGGIGFIRTRVGPVVARIWDKRK
jgi:hypothetical protein